MGTKEVLEILDKTACKLLDEVKQEDDLDKTFDYFIASSMIMSQYLELKLKTSTSPSVTSKKEGL